MGEIDMHKTQTSQAGVVLVVSLIMLLLLTIIGVAGVQSTSLEERMAGNSKDRNLAFQAAESALSLAEASLDVAGGLPTFSTAGTGGFYAQASTIPSHTAILTDSFWTSQPVATSPVTGLGNAIAAPLYIIQELPATCFSATDCAATPPLNKTPYKITVRATGGGANSTAVVILQSIYTPP
jgi:type IV pilus assembly protein PilX